MSDPGSNNLVRPDDSSVILSLQTAVSELSSRIEQLSVLQNNQFQFFMERVQSEIAHSVSSNAAPSVPPLVVNASSRGGWNKEDLPTGFKLQKPQFYSGDQSPLVVNAFLEDARMYLTFSGIAEHLKPVIAATFLSGDAHTWWHNHGSKAKLESFDDFARELRAQFIDPFASTAARFGLSKLKQKTSVAAYEKEFRSLLSLVDNMDEESKIHHFVMGLKPGVRSVYHASHPLPGTLTQVIDKARFIDSQVYTFSKFDRPAASQSGYSNNVPRRQSAISAQSSASVAPTTPVSSLDRMDLDHVGSRSLKCFACQGAHTLAKCPEFAAFQASRSTKNEVVQG